MVPFVNATPAVDQQCQISIITSQMIWFWTKRRWLYLMRRNIDSNKSSNIRGLRNLCLPQNVKKLSRVGNTPVPQPSQTISIMIYPRYPSTMMGPMVWWGPNSPVYLTRSESNPRDLLFDRRVAQTRETPPPVRPQQVHQKPLTVILHHKDRVNNRLLGRNNIVALKTHLKSAGNRCLRTLVGIYRGNKMNDALPMSFLPG